jgi:uncharacterized protein (DUF433 family)
MTVSEWRIEVNWSILLEIQLLIHIGFSKMEENNMEWKERITVNSKQCGGRPCIRGMRIRVIDVLDLMAAGLSREEILEELPDLEPADIEAALRYASSKLDHPVIAA